MLKLRLPEDLDPERFLHTYWQKKPLLIRGALPGFVSPLEPGELAGLACEEEPESRIVLQQAGDPAWVLRHGPFTEADFEALPETHWTLLVQDVDKLIPEVADLLEPFRFLPDWRVDDVMISYAADQGSVGPHTDDYDVFLIQGAGRRRWQIHHRPTSDADLMPGLDLRILSDFEAAEEWVLVPGDLLYLPPGVAHWGLAQGAGCMTYSVGFRAPTLRELAGAYCEDLIQRSVPSQRYRDAELHPTRTSAEISAGVLTEIRGLLDRSLTDSPAERDRWFGRFITEPKPRLLVQPAEEPLDARTLYTLLQERALLLRNGLSRMAFIRGSEGRDYLYVNGEELPFPSDQSGFLEILTQQRRLHFGYLADWLARGECLGLLTELYNRGHLHFDEE